MNITMVNANRFAPRIAFENESCDAWFERFDAYQRMLGRYGTRSQWRTWISPRIGAKQWRAVTTNDVEDIRDDLDRAVLAWQASGPGSGRISERTAMSVWWALRGALREATASKRRELRMLAGAPDPSLGVLPPADRASRRERSKTFVYPREFAMLVASRDIPVEWRRAYVIATYTFLRPSELRALRWRDIDLAHARLRVEAAWSYRDGRLTTPKSRAGVRELPIHDALARLFRCVVTERMPRANDPVVPLLAQVPRDTLAAQT